MNPEPADTPGRAYSNRYEIKYLVEARRMPEIEAALGGFLRPDHNGHGTNGYYNYSIYFDSPDYRLYLEKREGELIRIKPRLRLYRPGPREAARAMFLELKGRYDRIVTKRRAPVEADLASRLLSPGLPDLNGEADRSSALGEFLYLAHRFRLAPCVTVLYHRSAYVGAFYPDLRITFDRAVRCSRSTTLDNPEESFLYALPAHWLVIELKYNNKVPRLLLERFHSLGLQQATLSKFGVSLERSYDAAPTFHPSDPHWAN